MKNTRKQIDYNKIVNVAEDGEITVLHYIFFDTMHGEPFNGATGHKFYPVSREQYEERTEREYVIDYLIDAGLELPEQYKRGGFEALYDAMEANNEIDSLMFDTSYSELWDYMREALNLTEDQAVIFDCVGGGRCFEKGFKGNFNPELSAEINKAEGLKG
jgi:hypothetical protein